ncbi:MAG: SpoIIE family protein phosphatase [Vicinamibacterales bacterium]|jgi:serine phosphatase RsbU (regulator of sigma subunit)|nr:SpoIIE family protein phosphatase [Vicinamibacterales bacterium]
MQGPRVEVSDAMGRVQVVPVEDDPLTIGRAESNVVLLEGGEISRRHAEIAKEGERYILRDVGSHGGTFVNDKSVVEHALSHGDRIRIGRHADLQFLIGEAPDPVSRATTAGVRSLRQAATLLDWLGALGTAKVLDQLLAMVIDFAITLSGAERGFIMLPDPVGGLKFTLGRGAQQVTLSGEDFQTSRKIPEQVFATGKPQFISDLHDESIAQEHERTGQLPIRSVHCVPLMLPRYAERAAEVDDVPPVGVLYLDGPEEGSPSSQETQLGLQTLAAEAAFAIENNRLYSEIQGKARLERDLRTAHEFQQGLLPMAAPRHDYFSASAEMAPCRSIGGDFFDYLDLPGSFGFAVGDVAGKGAAAALLGARVQEIFSCLACDAPAVTMAAINSAMVKKTLQARFVAVFYGVLSPDGRLTYCNAGHNPPLLVGENGVRRLSTGGLIVGPFSEATYEQEVVTLSPGDTVITFSDGVSEALNAEGAGFGVDRIVECVDALPSDLEPSQLVQELLAAVRKFTVGEQQSDDITVLIARYRGETPPTVGRA